MKTKLIIPVLLMLIFVSCSKYTYQSIPDDPTGTRIYTLKNGLKVYLAQNDNQPRIETRIAVKVGAKNDPIETTGLAHYFEHLMFKGTKNYGTQDYSKEEPMLQKIEDLFEVYRKETDPQKRASIYAEIDSVSQESSKIAIPNEFDKLMASIGAEGINAWTSYDETVFTENIPSNQVENWAAIESDRFQNAVIRGFHTELETVYEEYNMYQTKDNVKIFYKLLETLFPAHPCGLHSVIGLQDHIKNPSIKNIKEFYSRYYVPNNYAICMCGDLDFDSTIEILDKYFGTIQPGSDIPEWKAPKEEEITSPKETEVWGLEAEMLYMGWRTPKPSDEESLIESLVISLLNNGKCGLLDVDLNQSQKVMGAAAGDLSLADEGALVLIGYPKQDQTLNDVKELLLEEVKKLKNGDFDETLISSTIANYKLSQMSAIESSGTIVSMFLNSYINGIPWDKEISGIKRAEKIKKEDIVNWANKYLTDSSYVAVYKRSGEDPNVKKIDKPHITPIATNRDESSRYLDSIRSVKVETIQPKFVDFKKDMTITKTENSVPVLYKQNTTNEIFSLSYIFETGSNADPALGFAAQDYFSLLGTDSKSLQEIQKQLYDIACSFSIHIGGERSSINVHGLSENMSKATEIVEDYIANVKGDDNILNILKSNELKSRFDTKLDQSANLAALRKYAAYGAENIKKMTLSNEDLIKLTSDELIEKIKGLRKYNYRISYYGPLSVGKLLEKLNAGKMMEKTTIEPEHVTFKNIVTDSDKVIMAHYDAKQINFIQYSCQDEKYSPDIEPAKTLFNSYFGSGMSGIVFQEMREARGLAYTARATYSKGEDLDKPYTFYAFIGTQNDKVEQAVKAFDDIIENMPQSDNAFEIAKESVLNSIVSSRTTKGAVLSSWIKAEDYGLDYDINKKIYEEVKNMTIEDVKKFHDKYIKGRKYSYLILGDEKEIDMNFVKTLGPVEMVSREMIFGF